MPNNPTSWLMFLFFAIGAAGGLLYLWQVIRSGMAVQLHRATIPAYRPAPMAARTGRVARIEPEQPIEIETKDHSNDKRN